MYDQEKVFGDGLRRSWCSRKRQDGRGKDNMIAQRKAGLTIAAVSLFCLMIGGQACCKTGPGPHDGMAGGEQRPPACAQGRGSERGVHEVGRDGAYIAYADGVVRDTCAGLDWVAGPDEYTTLEEAMAWVKGLHVDGGGWRMPSERELQTLYKTGAGIRNMTPLLKMTGYFVWCVADHDLTTGRRFYFAYEIRPFHPRGDHTDGRAFAVRSATSP